VKKKYGIILPILLIIEILIVINPVNAFNCNLISFETNQTEYYINEDIKINASWELYYNPVNEIAYTQIHILNNSDQIIWNSSRNNQIGIYEQNWTVNIEEFDLDFKNNSYILFVKFFMFYFQIDTTNTMYTYLETIEIRVIRRNISCELIGYENHIKLGESLFFAAMFYDETSEIIQYLSNQTVLFLISFDDSIIHQCNYTTNDTGAVSVHLSTLTHLNLGKNLLIFSISNSSLYNDSNFIYEIIVEKNDLIIEILTFDNYLENGEDLEIRLSCYYYINQYKYWLENYNLLIKIYNKKTLTYIDEFETNNLGLLEVSISQDSFNDNQTSQNFTINIFFNGTYSLNNKTLILSLNLNQDIISETQNSFQMTIFSFTSVLIVILIFLSYIIINKRSKSEKLLSELVIKY
jgi:hypothetical protein